MNYSRKGLGKLYQFFTQSLGMNEYRNGWLKGTCPSCNRHLKFGVNLSLGVTNCFVCGYNKKPIWVVGDILNLTSLAEIHGALSSHFQDDVYFRVYTEIKERDYGQVTLPESFTRLLTNPDSTYGKMIRRYVKRRKLDPESLHFKGFGYCTRGNYAGRLIMPFYYSNLLIYYHSRSVLSVSGEKFKNPSEDEAGIGKNLVLYNWDSLGYYKKIYLVESVINAETLGDYAIAGGGKALSTFQLSQILKSPVEEVVVVLDPDAMSEAVKVGFFLLGHKQVKIIRLPEGKDVNDVGANFVYHLENETPYATLQSLKSIQAYA